MSITIGSWILPVIATAVMVGIAGRPYRSCGDYDFGFVMRLFWIIPILAVWVIYFAIMYFTHR